MNDELAKLGLVNGSGIAVLRQLCVRLAVDLIFCNEEYAVAGGNAEEGDEADDGRDTEAAGAEPDGENAADEGEGKVEKYDEGKGETAEFGVEQEVDDGKGKDEDEDEGSGCGAGTFELTTIFNAVAFRQFDFGVDGTFNVVDDTDGIAAADIGRNDEFALNVLA